MQNSDHPKFKIVLTGFPKFGVSMPTAEQNLSELLKIELSRTKNILQGRPSTIKRNLTAENVDKYRKALDQTGVEYQIVDDEPELLSTNKFEKESSAIEPPKLTRCPLCGYKAKDKDDPLITKYNGLGECPKCGIIPQKYINIQHDKEKNINQINQQEKTKTFILHQIIDTSYQKCADKIKNIPKELRTKFININNLISNKFTVNVINTKEWKSIVLLLLGICLIAIVVSKIVTERKVGKITTQCVMDVFGQGHCSFSNNGNAPSSVCGKVVVINKQNNNSDSTPIFCSGKVENMSTNKIEFSISSVQDICQLSGTSFSWSDICEFNFIPSN